MLNVHLPLGKMMNVHMGLGSATKDIQSLEPGTRYLILPDIDGVVFVFGGDKGRVDFSGSNAFVARKATSAPCYELPSANVSARPGARVSGDSPNLSAGSLVRDASGELFMAIATSGPEFAFLSFKSWTIGMPSTREVWNNWSLIQTSGDREVTLKEFAIA